MALTETYGELWPLLAYADSLSVPAGAELKVMVSSVPDHFEAALVRLGAPGHPGLEQRLASPIDGIHPGRLQELHAGSYVETQPLQSPNGAGYCVQAWVCPTLPGEHLQVIVSQGEAGAVGWSLELDLDGRPRLREWSGSQETILAQSDVPLAAHSWYFLAAGLDGEQGVSRIAVSGASQWMDPRLISTEVAYVANDAASGEAVSACIGACRSQGGAFGTHVFNGKIEAPRLFAGPLGQDQLLRLRAGEAPVAVAPGAVLGDWDFSLGIDSLTVTDRSPSGAHGRCVNLPARAAAGHRWHGQALGPQEDPGLYGAIHFHDDDLADAGWTPDLHLPVPTDLQSGLYAVKLSSGAERAYVPFYVRPQTGAPTARVLLIAPTNTYLAYANRRDVDLTERPVPLDVPLRLVDELLATHPTLGGSLYDLHSDGSGVCYSSRLRPILTTDPTYIDVLLDGPRHFAADLHLIAWLTAQGQPFDVATDEDLHREGHALLHSYDVVLSGSHPEYCSTRMLDAIDGYLEGGGSLMYLGGNGFYWVTSYHPELPHVIEVRKGFSGTRNWQVAPGEEHHSTTFERGGLWRHRGRSAHYLTGVGTTGHAAAKAVGYRRLEASYEESVRFVFTGVEGERFGAFGLALGGAAGDEVDATDLTLGTPAHARVLAVSDTLAGYVPMMEDELWYRPERTGEHNPRIRSELVLLETGHGGAVFSVGSVSWCAALPVNDYDNDVSRITANVMRDFLGRSRERESARDDADR